MNRALSHRSSSARVDNSDRHADRRAELLRLPPHARILEIEAELNAIGRKGTAAATFHRKKLLRMHDDARLEMKLVTPARLHEENSPFTGVDFAKASIVWGPRVRVSD